MKHHECPHCGERYPSSCPYIHQYDLRPVDKPCGEFWQDASGYDPDAKYNERRDEPRRDYDEGDV